MLYLQIQNLGKFTALLFSSDGFDRFLLHDATFETMYTSVFEGRKNEAYFTDEEKEEALSDSYVLWSEIRPAAFELLKGKKLPVSFRVTLLTSRKNTASIVERSGFSGCPVTSLSLSLQYREQKLYLRTGVSYQGFSMDRSLEKYWDDQVLSFLSRREIEVQEPEE